MRILKYLLVLGVVVAFLGAGVVALAVWHFSRDLPAYQQLASYQPDIVSRVYAGDGRLVGEYSTQRRVFVPIAAMPPLVIRAFLAAEDKNFYTHYGVDPVSILRAGTTDVMHLVAGTGKRPVGASTITQQIAKNFLLSNEVSLSRKVKEALLAIRIEQVLSKDRILELYLNEIYLGGGAYGVAAAALQYFSKPLDEVTIAEAAYLAALPKGPNNYNPQRFPNEAKGRRDWVVDRMREEGYVTAAEAALAQQGPVQTQRRDEADTIAAGYFAEEVRRELLARYGEKGLYRSGLAVRASLDPKLQVAADKALRAGLIAYDRRHGWRGPIDTLSLDAANWQAGFATLPLPPGAGEWKLAIVTALDGDGAAIALQNGSAARIPFDELKWARPTLEDQRVGPVPKKPAEILQAGNIVLVEEIAPADGKRPASYGLRQIPNVGGGFVAMDPHTGRILAISGGFSWEMSQFDRAVQAKRQPGSSFKPFVYMAALDHGFTPSTLVLDAPFVADQGPGLPKWKPTNYNTTKFAGPLPLRQGIEQSKNMMTARLGQVVGIDVVAELAERFGVYDRAPRVLSMFLGAGETTVLRQVTAYSQIVNGGRKITPTLIDRVQDRNGVTIFRADNRACTACKDLEWTGQEPPEIPDTRATIEDPRTAYQMVSILQGVVERGTGTAVKAVGKPLAGKTGTTNDYQDNWFVGFAPDLAAGVYIGFDNPRTLGERETGGSDAAPIFRDFMAVALKDKPALAFRIPPGIRLVRADPKTGQPARAGDRNVIYEAYKPGTEYAGGPVVSGNGTTDDEPTAAPASGVPGVPSPAVPASGTGGLY